MYHDDSSNLLHCFVHTCSVNYHLIDCFFCLSHTLTACNCDPRGTVGGSSSCGADSGGQCSCKVNVQSSLCDSCENMFFNLTESNPDGCQGTVHACVVVCVDLLSILTSAGMHVYTVKALLFCTWIYAVLDKVSCIF